MKKFIPRKKRWFWQSQPPTHPTHWVFIKDQYNVIVKRYPVVPSSHKLFRNLWNIQRLRPPKREIYCFHCITTHELGQRSPRKIGPNERILREKYWFAKRIATIHDLANYANSNNLLLEEVIDHQSHNNGVWYVDISGEIRLLGPGERLIFRNKRYTYEDAWENRYQSYIQEALKYHNSGR